MIIGSNTLQIENGTLWYRKLLKAAGQGHAAPENLMNLSMLNNLLLSGER